MKVYLYACDTDAFRHLVTDDGNFDVLDSFQRESLANEWFPLLVELRGQGNLPIPDILQLDYRIPVLTHKALQVLKPHVPKDIELLKLRCPDQQLSAFNLIRSCDCLDARRSDIRRNRFGNIVEVRTGVFDYAKIASRGMFTIPMHGGVFITEQFYNCVVQSELTGLLCKEVGAAA